MTVDMNCLGVAVVEPFTGQDGVPFNGGYRLCLQHELFAPAGGKGVFAETRFVGRDSVRGLPVEGAVARCEVSIGSKGLRIQGVEFVRDAK